MAFWFVFYLRCVETETDQSSHLLVHSSNTHSSQNGIELSLGTKTSIQPKLLSHFPQAFDFIFTQQQLQSIDFYRKKKKKNLLSLFSSLIFFFN